MRRMSSIMALAMSILVTGLLPCRAESPSWDVTAGFTHVFRDEWTGSWRLAAGTYWRAGATWQYGVQGAAEIWRPNEKPSGLVGVNWEPSGAAWLFEAGPAVRWLPDAARGRLFWQGGVGIAVVTSNAEIMVEPVVPHAISHPVDIMGSQAAPYVESGLGVISRGSRPGLEASVMARSLFVDPKVTALLSVQLGLSF
jgi:hypothetical protein